MKPLSTDEKLVIIRHIGANLSTVGYEVRSGRRADVIRWAERIVELAKTLPEVIPAAD